MSQSLRGNMAGSETKRSWEIFARHRRDRMNACIFTRQIHLFGVKAKLCTMPTWGTITFILMKPAICCACDQGHQVNDGFTLS